MKFTYQTSSQGGSQDYKYRRKAQNKLLKQKQNKTFSDRFTHFEDMNLGNFRLAAVVWGSAQIRPLHYLERHL